MTLHNDIMNLPCDAPADVRVAYKLGHRDARHAAAELSLKYERYIRALEAKFEIFYSPGYVESMRKDYDL